MSPSIDMLVSFGNFHTIRTWTWTFAQKYPSLNFPLEQFFQVALYHIVPGQAKAYDPAFGNSFQSFVIEMLKKRFSAFAKTHKRELSSPVGYEEKAATKKGRPAARRERVMLVSLDAPMQQVETPQTVFEFLETTHQAPQDETLIEDREAREKIHLLSQLAGLNDKQEETLVALFIYGGNTRLIAQLRRSTSRSVRGQRQTALERIQELGYETVNGILSGTTPPQRG
jgi:DNA-directed RNA polymerase specialized sigma24 family protein